MLFLDLELCECVVSVCACVCVLCVPNVNAISTFVVRYRRRHPNSSVGIRSKLYAYIVYRICRCLSIRYDV